MMEEAFNAFLLRMVSLGFPMNLFEKKPRFKKCPPICEMANLPSFETKQHAKQYHQDTNPRGIMWEPWLCRFCGHWHYLSETADPSGGSSGTGRNARHYKND